MRAVDECECVRLSRASFERLLRPVRAKLKEAVAKYPVVQTEKEGGEIAGVPEEYARRVGLRAVVHGVIEAICIDRPDAVLPWLRDHLVTTYAGSVAAAPPKLLSAALGPWKSRDDVDANTLQAYLGEMGVREVRARFVDIAAPDYDPAANQGLSYEAAMEEIHAILPDGTVVRGIEVFRRLYEEVGLGFVYAATKNEAVERAANRVYGFWARFRMQLTGRGDMAAVLAKRAAGDASTCRQGVGGGEPGAGSPP